MAQFPYAVRAWLFCSALDDMAAAYRAAERAHIVRPTEIEMEVREKLSLGATDPFPERDDSNENDPVGATYDWAMELEEQAKRGQHLVRKAFLIALFHHWERHCNRELGHRSYSHPSKWLSDRGKQNLAKDILKLARAANCAKHGPGHSCKDLFKMSPGLFPRAKQVAQASESTLVVEIEFIEHMFSVVREAAL